MVCNVLSHTGLCVFILPELIFKVVGSLKVNCKNVFLFPHFMCELWIKRSSCYCEHWTASVMHFLSVCVSPDPAGSGLRENSCRNLKMGSSGHSQQEG